MKTGILFHEENTNWIIGVLSLSHTVEEISPQMNADEYR